MLGIVQCAVGKWSRKQKLSALRNQTQERISEDAAKVIDLVTFLQPFNGCTSLAAEDVDGESKKREDEHSHKHISSPWSPSNEDRPYDLSTVDPHVWCGRSGRAPPSRARRLRSREEGGAALRDMVEIRSTREERGSAQGQDNLDKFMCWGAPSHLFIERRGGGSPRGGALG